MVPQFTDNKANLICQAYNPVLHELSILQNDTMSAKLESVQHTNNDNNNNIHSPHNTTNNNNNNNNDRITYLDGGIWNYYLNSITNLMASEAQQHQQQQHPGHYSFQLFTSVPLDVNCKLT